MVFWLVDRAAAARNRLNEARQDARHVAMPFGKQRQQLLVDPVELGANIFLAGAIGGGFGHWLVAGPGSTALGLHAIERFFAVQEATLPRFSEQLTHI